MTNEPASPSARAVELQTLAEEIVSARNGTEGASTIEPSVAKAVSEALTVSEPLSLMELLSKIIAKPDAQ